MLNSKAVKQEFSDRWHDSRIRTWLRSTYYSILRPFRHAKKMYQWYMNVFRHDYDFDGMGLINIIRYKLERLQKSMRNGHLKHEEVHLKALRIAIKLAKRLDADNYDTRAWDRHEKKWGKHEYWMTPDQDRPYFSYHSRWPKAVFAKQKEQCDKEYKEGQEISLKCRDRDSRNLFNIINKYLRYWWD